jgi:hypothetical protein
VFTKSLGNCDDLSRCEQDIHAIVTHLPETAFSLELSRIQLKSCMKTTNHPHSHPWESQQHVQLCSAEEVTVLRVRRIPASAK